MIFYHSKMKEALNIILFFNANTNTKYNITQNKHYGEHIFLRNSPISTLTKQIQNMENISFTQNKKNFTIINHAKDQKFYENGSNI